MKRPDSRPEDIARDLVELLRRAAAELVESPGGRGVKDSLARLLQSLAVEVEEYHHTQAQATGTNCDPQTWQDAFTTARAVLGEEPR